jgi:hypothetical protein
VIVDVHTYGRSAPYLTELAVLQKSRHEVSEVSKLIAQRDAENGVVVTRAAIAIRNLPAGSVRISAPLRADEPR